MVPFFLDNLARSLMTLILYYVASMILNGFHDFVRFL